LLGGVLGGIPANLQLRLFGDGLDKLRDFFDLVNKTAESYSEQPVEVLDWPTAPVRG